MKVFVLLLLITSGENSIVSAEFNSRENCEAAGNAAVAKLSGVLKRGKFICIEK